MATSPVDRVWHPRSKSIPRDRLEPYVRQTSTYVPDLGALQEMTVLARTDGLFVLKVTLSRAVRFNGKYIDELATAISMAAKTVLGHHHDVHGQGHTPPGRPLSAGDILFVPPVMLQPEQGAEIFNGAEELRDELLKEAECVLPERAPDDDPRPALIVLRRHYLKVFENLQSHLTQLRTVQLAWVKSPLTQLMLFLPASLATLALLLIVNPYSIFAASGQQTILSLFTSRFFFVAALFGCSYLFFGEIIKFRKWEKTRIRLLRSSVTFFHYANPLNEVVRRIMAPDGEVYGFSDLIGALESKTNGEIHRGSISQLWMTLALAFAALMVSWLGIGFQPGQPDTKPATAARPGSDASTPRAEPRQAAVVPRSGSADALPPVQPGAPLPPP